MSKKTKKGRHRFTRISKKCSFLEIPLFHTWKMPTLRSPLHTYHIYLIELLGKMGLLKSYHRTLGNKLGNNRIPLFCIYV